DAKSEGDWLAPTGAGGAREEAVAAAARPKRPEGLGAEARQYEKRKRRDQLSKPNVLHPQKCLHFEGEGYLAQES
ncbi:hypothetical protein, partial [Parageobacillus toebii]|uniref:hypothetical protein n=1 Tax=Parageobacillus toebii TaxID=153151 RepID=UPI000AC9DD4D